MKPEKVHKLKALKINNLLFVFSQQGRHDDRNAFKLTRDQGIGSNPSIPYAFHPQAINYSLGQGPCN
jgi:hypothetical protein